MKRVHLLLTLFFTLSSVQGGTVILAVSGTQSTIAAPGTPHNATTQTINYALGNISDIPSAKWIWDGLADAYGCNLNILITHSFKLVCQGLPINLTIRADDKYWANLNGQSFVVPTYQPLKSYIIPTTNVSCGQELTLQVNATNTPGYVGSLATCTSSAIGGVLYAVTSPDCPCAVGTFYQSSICGCKACSIVMNGCGACTTSTVCTSCANNTYLLISSACQLCSSYIGNCSTCSSTTTCTSCISTHQLDSGVCKLCSQFLTNCVTCSSKTACTSCSAGYAVNLTTCAPCSFFMAGCLSCTDNITCTVCDPTNNLSVSDTKCSCAPGFAQSGTSCQTCNNFISNCLTCTSATNCSSCSSGYLLYNYACSACSVFLTGCATCTTSTVCNSCLNNNYVNINGMCKLCNVWLIGCLNCSSISTCVVCDTNNNFALSGTSCICSSGSYLNGSSCNSCGLTLPNCASCTSSSTCSGCSDTSFVFATTGCTKCSSTMAGCLNCTSLSSCTTCDTASNFVATGSACRCKDNYMLNGQVCYPCAVFMDGCLNCSSKTVCTLCSAGFGILNSSCIICSDAMAGCLTCTNSTNCLSCDTSNHFIISASKCICQTGYLFINTTCIECSKFIVGCASCVSELSCTLCKTAENFYLNSGLCVCSERYVLNGSTCSLCSGFMNGCQTCSYTQNCTRCSSTLHFSLAGTQCVCSAGYYASGLNCVACDANCGTCNGTATNCTSCKVGFFLTGSSCTACSVGCGTCSSATKCTQCLTDFILDDSKCICKDGTFLNVTTSVCDSCHPTCYTCTASLLSNCLSCVDIQFRLLSGNTCACNGSNYVESASTYPKCKIVNSSLCRDVQYWDAVTESCNQICGDGKLYTLECDDGNLNNGDGCSSTCKIEQGFTCVNGSWANQSLCSYSGPMQLDLKRTIKDPNSNSLTFTFDVYPGVQLLSDIPDLKSYFKTNIPTNGMNVKLENGKLVVEVNYTESIQGQIAQIQFNPPKGARTFAMTSSVSSFTVQPDNNIPANAYDAGTYQTQKYTGTAVIALEGAAYGTFVAFFFIAKSISLELLSMLQTTYFGLVTVNNINPISASLYNLRHMSGYNQMFANFGLKMDYNPPTDASKRLLQDSSSSSGINARLWALGYNGPHLIENFNYMYILIVALIVVFGIVYLVGMYQKSQKILRVATYVLKNMVFTFLFFSVNNMGFSLGVQFRYLVYDQDWTAQMTMSWVLAVVTLVILIFYLYYYIRYTVEFTEFRDKFRDDWLSRCHYAVYLIARYLVNIFCGYFNDHSELCFAIVAFELFCFIYLVIKRPYKQKLFLFLALLNELSVLAILTIDMYYRNFSKTDVSSQSVIICGWIQLVLALICVVANYIALAIYIYQRCCTKNNKVHDGVDDEKERKNQNSYIIEKDQPTKDQIKTSSVDKDHSGDLIFDDDLDDDEIDQKHMHISLDKARKDRKKKRRSKNKRWL